MKKQNCKRTCSPVILLNRIILGKICKLDVWYSAVNFLLAFGNHEWKPLVLELGNGFIQLLIHCSSYWINSKLALYNRLHSLWYQNLQFFLQLIDLDSFSTTKTLVYSSRNCGLHWRALYWKLTHNREARGILKLMVWTEAMFWNCVTSKIVRLKIAY